MDFHRIYAEHAEDYDALVRAEDCDGHLAAALGGWLRHARANVLEIGVGTGRITEILCARGANVLGCEPAPAMLAIARRRLARWTASAQLELLPTDCVGLPALPPRFELAIAGWVFGHLRSWRAADWRAAIDENLQVVERALAPGGALVLIETLGTGEATPRPRPELAEYHAWLEQDCGFERRVLRTDYLFADVEAAARATEFFFGGELAGEIRRAGSPRIPECTGLWSRQAGVRPRRSSST